MTHEIQITLPKLGESIVSATVVRWCKKEGESVALDEALLEVSTDKVNSEIPSPKAGILKKILAFPEAEVQVGDPLAILLVGENVSTGHEAPIEEKKSLSSSMDRSEEISPAVLRFCREQQLDLSELAKIPRTGEGGRLTKKDIEAYCETKPSNRACQNVERLVMSPLRKAIAENMVRSFYEAPHTSLMTKIDVTDLSEHIKKEKESFFSRHGVKLSITSFAARALAKAIGEYPLIKSSLEKLTIVVKKFVNLGIAVSVDHGVMVPVIRHCQGLSLAEIAQQVSVFGDKAKRGTLHPDDVQEGTVTMTNFGMTGILMGTPIIRFPEVAIIGLGAISKEVMVVHDTEMAIRSCMWVTLTFDHRVLDGLYGCGFLSSFGNHLSRDLSL